jgi:hypothetical protein
MKKLIGIVIVATSIGSPALAQSFDPDNGTGNLGANIVAAAPARADSGIVTGTLGVDAYAMSARKKAASGTEAVEHANTSGDNTGGGSAGYNEMLRNNW